MEPGRASEIISRSLNVLTDVSAVICTGQADTEGAGLSSEKDFPERNLFIAGFDLSPKILQLIKREIITCTIDQQPYLQGFLPVVQLSLYIRYGILPSNVDAGANIINRYNAGYVLNLSKKGYR